MNKEVSTVKVMITILLLAILEAFLVIYFIYNKKEEMCSKATCNADKAVCSVFEKDAEGHIEKVWQGSCN